MESSASSSSSSLTSVISTSLLLPGVKLDRNNYSIWRTQILPSVRAHCLEEYLFGTSICPSRTIDSSDKKILNPEFVAWNRVDQFLLGWLFNSISDAMIGHVQRCVTSAELWQTLEEQFSSKSRSRILQLRSLLQSTKKGSSTVEEYILKMRSIADSLQAAGNPITEDDLILQILGGVAPEYEAVVITLSAKDTLTMGEVLFMLQSQEIRLEQNSSSFSALEFNPSAQYARTNFGTSAQRFQQRGNTNGRGTSSRGGRFQRGGRTNNRLICQVCGKPGHSAIKCFHRYDLNYENSESRNSGNTAPMESRNPFSGGTSQQHHAQVYMASPEVLRDDAWYMDSGATNHVTHNEAAMTSSHDFKGKQKLAVGSQHEEDSAKGQS